MSQPTGDLLIGVWRLHSAEYRSITNGENDVSEVIPYLGPNPQGQLIYTSNGDMSVQLMASGRPCFALNDRLSGSSEEVRAAFEGYHSYFGIYRVEGSQVVHGIQGSTFPNFIGTSQVRQFELKLANTMKMKNNLEAEYEIKGVGETNMKVLPSHEHLEKCPTIDQPFDELTLKTSVMSMRGKPSIGYLIWRRQSKATTS